MEEYEKRAQLAEEQILLLEDKINKLVNLVNNEMQTKVVHKNEQLSTANNEVDELKKRIKELESKESASQYRLSHLIRELNEQEEKYEVSKKEIDMLNYRINTLVRSLDEEENK
eukprot:TRINITY_DN7864_c0_g1_i1.p1 TRINITY_DN7864_c0_g1~~TRINITY_DN7864_c0_g1_i1.p1  ORF type:complete len:122 (-),score=36.75 TRINITY_DN7864_c0_g1_i1:38-379(-)